jgi:predicted nucleic acid-binding protein
MNKQVLLDTNLAVLLVVGLVKPAQIGVHKKTTSFDDASFDLLKSVLGPSAGLIFTPHILAEVSNLLRYTKDPLKTEVTEFLASHLLEEAEEIPVFCREGATRSEYGRLGLTDAAILHLAQRRGDIVILTDDLDLYLAAVHDGLDAINFTHLRVEAGLLD